MPKKSKSQFNSFGIFLDEFFYQKKQAGYRGGKGELVGEVSALYQVLSQQEKEKYENMAQKAKLNRGVVYNSAQTEGITRFNNRGVPVGCDHEKSQDVNERRRRNAKILRNEIPLDEQGLLNYQFYFISFHYMCEMDISGKKTWLPAEVGIVEYSFKKGFTAIFSAIIEHGEIPLGYRYNCMEHFQDTHQIPLDCKEAISCVSAYLQLKQFVERNCGESDAEPIIFALDNEVEMCSYLMQFIFDHSHSKGQCKLSRILDYNCLVQYIMSTHCETQCEDSGTIRKTVLSTSWDYIPGTLCDFHQGVDSCRHCALLAARRLGFAMSSTFKDYLNFNAIIGNHLPVEQTDSCFEELTPMVLPPSKIPAYRPPEHKEKIFYNPNDIEDDRDDWSQPSQPNDPFPFKDNRYPENLVLPTTKVPNTEGRAWKGVHFTKPERLTLKVTHEMTPMRDEGGHKYDPLVYRKIVGNLNTDNFDEMYDDDEEYNNKDINSGTSFASVNLDVGESAAWFPKGDGEMDHKPPGMMQVQTKASQLLGVGRGIRVMPKSAAMPPGFATVDAPPGFSQLPEPMSRFVMPIGRGIAANFHMTRNLGKQH